MTGRHSRICPAAISSGDCLPTMNRAERSAGVRKVTVTARVGTPVRPPENAYDRVGHVIAVGDDAGQVLAALAQAADLLTVRVDVP